VKILIGSPVRTSEEWQVEAFKHYLKSLDDLEIPAGAQVDRLFLLHNSPQLGEIVQEGPIKTGFQYLADVKSPEQYRCDEQTHNWKLENIMVMVAMRNNILDFARAGEYDYYLMVDADLVLQPKTLIALIEARKDIVAECFWTKWAPAEDSPEGPNAWDFDAIGFAPNFEARCAEWKRPGLYRIGMSGACILLSKQVIQCPTVNYNPIFNISFFGEDRYFCIRAAVNGFEIWLDTHLPPVHLYRPSEVEKYVRQRLL